MSEHDKLKLEFPTIKRKKEALEFMEEFYEHNSKVFGSGGLIHYLNDYEGWIEKIKEDAIREFTEEKVPARTYFLIREHDNRIVGIISIRFKLNKHLQVAGGNIGYSIRPTERRKGYNKVNLYLGLLECQKYGIKEALMTCDKTNLASAKTIKALGGEFIREREENEKTPRMVYDFILNVDKLIEEHRDEYFDRIIIE